MLSWKPTEFNEQEATQILNECLSRLDFIKGWQPDILQYIREHDPTLYKAWDDVGKCIDLGFITRDMEIVKTTIPDYEELSKGLLKVYKSSLKGAA